MFAVPGLIGLILLIYIKPQEFLEPLQGLPLLYLMLGATVLGLVLDLRLKLARFDPPPNWPFVVAFVVWCLVTRVVVSGTDNLVGAAVDLIIPVILFFAIATGVQSFRSFNVVAASVLAASMFVAGVCFHQGLAPLGCAVQAGEELETLRPDGRPCERAEDCYLGDAEPGASYQCERMGLFGTVSVGRGRVRYRGVLKDPNEVALTLGASLPILFARAEYRSTVFRWLAIVIGVPVVATVIVYSQSRGGILVFLTVIGAYFVRKYGVKGLVAGAIAGAPLLLLGGRSGDEAKASANERSGILLDGVNMVIGNPVFGVGYGRFGDHAVLTAHNSYMLAIAENGVLGLYLFLGILYISFKICLGGVRRYAHVGEAHIARSFTMMGLASLAGVCVGAFFLSFTYHQVLWIYLGLVASLYVVVRRHDPTFRVGLSLKEHAALGVACVAFIVILRTYLRAKGF